MATYTNANKQLLDRALNILFKQYIGVSATSLDNLVDPFNESYTTRQIHRDPSLLWTDIVPTVPESRDASGALVYDEIHPYYGSTSYTTGEYFWDGTTADGAISNVYVVTGNFTSSGTSSSNLKAPVFSSWEY